MKNKITIIIPCFNEKNFIREILRKVNNQRKDLDLQITVSDDGSDDGTYEFLLNNKSLYDDLIRNDINSGKGSAIKKAIDKIKGDVTIIQDADLEYSPTEYKKLIFPILELNADITYGNRFSNYDYERLHYFSHRIANFLLTLLVNIFTNVNFKDVECGFKVFKTNILKNITINENSFGFEIEITKKICKKGYKIFQVPVSYNGRSYSDGKKIKLKDAFRALYCILRY